MRLRAFPYECSKCPAAAKPRFGCGFDERYRDKAEIKYESDVQTCPRYFVEGDPDIAYVLSNLDDYRRGALGPTGLLDAPLVDALRTAESAIADWSNAMEVDA